MVADEHHLAGFPLWVEAPATVCEHHLLHAQSCRGANAVGDSSKAFAFVVVRSAPKN